MGEDKNSILELTAEIVAAYVSNNSVPMTNLTELLSSVHASLNKLGADAVQEQTPLVPAVAIKKSVTPDFIISLEDGRKFKSLKRHLSSHHNMTPEEYRAKWGLPSDYPMVAPNYAATRSKLAKSMGLGRKAMAAEAAAASKPVPPKSAGRGRRRAGAEV